MLRCVCVFVCVEKGGATGATTALWSSCDWRRERKHETTGHFVIFIGKKPYTMIKSSNLFMCVLVTECVCVCLCERES